MQSSSNHQYCRLKQFDSVIVLDLDDTLYLERDYVESGLQAVGNWAHQQLGIAGLGTEMLDIFREGTRGHIFDEALIAAGITPSSERVARMLQVYRQHRPRIHLTEDAERFLARRSSQNGIAIITDGFLDAQKRKIRALGLHQRGIQLAVCTDRWGRADWKPSPRAFDHVQSFFQKPPSAYVYIADNVNKDFHAPKRLGWSTIQIKRPSRMHTLVSQYAESADRVVTSFDDL